MKNAFIIKAPLFIFITLNLGVKEINNMKCMIKGNGYLLFDLVPLPPAIVIISRSLIPIVRSPSCISTDLNRNL